MAPLTDPPLRILIADFQDENQTTTVTTEVAHTTTTTVSTLIFTDIKEAVVRESEETIMMIFVLALVAFLIFQFYR